MEGKFPFNPIKKNNETPFVAPFFPLKNHHFSH
jgi:hypothetical protein